jgi:multidrug efflux pump subunit AcrB
VQNDGAHPAPTGENDEKKAGRTGTHPARFRKGAMQRPLIVIGLVIAAIGLAWPWLRRLPFGRLPGDIHVVREGFSFHFPIVTCIVISIVVSVVLWLFRR